MDGFDYNIGCSESPEENITLKNNNSIPINNCNTYNNYTSDLYLEREYKKIYIF